MRDLYILLVTLLMLFLLVGCGGGGSGSAVNFNGLWEGQLFRQSNTCPFNADIDSYLASHEIFQDGLMVTVDVSARRKSYTGEANSNSFTASLISESEQIFDDVFRARTLEINYTDANTSNANVEVFDSVDCASAASPFVCESSFVGVVQRQN